MQPTEDNKPENKTPDFVEDPKKINEFGEEQEGERQQESFPNMSNQSQTGNATGIDDLQENPTSDGDDSLA